MWTALSEWETGLTATLGPTLQNNLFTDQDVPVVEGAIKHVNHHDEFLNSLQKLNTFTREENVAAALSVRDMYDEWATLSSDMTEWLTALVADLNVDNDLNMQVMGYRKSTRVFSRPNT